LIFRHLQAGLFQLLAEWLDPVAEIFQQNLFVPEQIFTEMIRRNVPRITIRSKPLKTPVILS
jgi:hypothetical protein